MTAEAFLRLLLPTLGVPEPRLEQAIDDGVREHVGKAAQLPLVDLEPALTALSQAQQRQVQQVSDALVAELSRCLPIPDGEAITTVSPTCLSAAHRDRPAGTVVVVVTTNLATRLLLLPYLRVDLATGAPSLHLPEHPAVPETLAAATSSSTITDDVLKLGGVLAFALPPPWGPIVSGVFSLFELLFGGSPGPDPFAEVIATLQSYLQQQNIAQWGRVIEGFLGGSNGLQTQLEVLKQTLSADQTVYINDTLLPMINRATDPGSSDNVYGAMNSLHDTTAGLISSINSETRQQYYQAGAPSLEDTLDLTLLSVTSFLLGLKLKIQLYATLAKLAQDAGDDTDFDRLTGAWLDAYAVYAVNINGDAANDKPGLVQTMTTLITNAAAARASLVGPVYSVGYEGVSSGMYTYYVECGLGFTDAAIEDPSIDSLQPPPPQNGLVYPQHYIADGPAGPGCCDYPVPETAAITQERVQYLADIAAPDAERHSIVQGWADSEAQWSSHLPPKAPPSPPTIAAAATWAASTPQGQSWVDGNAVSYAVAFANSSGPGQRGDFGDWTPITNKAFPTVSVPTDPLAMATARWVYRRFRSSAATVQVIGVIPDNTTTSYLDKHV